MRYSTFKIRVDSVKEFAIGFELFAGDRAEDTYTNVLSTGGYGIQNRLILTPIQFKDFSERLLAYVYTQKQFSENQLMTLYEFCGIIYDSDNPLLGSSIFRKKEDALKYLITQKNKELEDRKRRL